MTPSPTWPPWQRRGKIGGVVEEVVGVVEVRGPQRGGEGHQVPGECAAEDCWTYSTFQDSGAVPGPEEAKKIDFRDFIGVHPPIKSGKTR